MSSKFFAVAGMTLALVSQASVSAAQEYSGAATLGFGRAGLDEVDGKLSILSLDGKFDMKFDNGLSFGADMSVNRATVDDVSESITASVFGIEAGYTFASNFGVGGYVERAEADIEDFGLDLSSTSYGLTGGYSSERSNFKVFVGETDSGEEGIDVIDAGFTVGFQAAPTLFLGGSLINTNLSDGDDDFNLSTMGVAAIYGVDDSFTVFGAIADTSLDGLDADLMTLGLGVSYDLTQVASFASSVSLELARTNLEVEGGDLNLDTVRLGFTIPVGGGSAKVPLNSVAGAVLNPRHTADSSFVLSTF